MIEQSWTEYFKIKLALLEESYNKQPSPNLSLLSYALKNNFINSQEYLEWAQKRYDLPILSNEFFNKNLDNHKMWDSWKKLYPWKIEIQPLANWDGHLIIGCLEVPDSFPVELKAIFLLCNFSDLELSWNSKLSTAKISPATTATPPAAATPTPALPEKVNAPASTNVSKPMPKKTRYILNALFDKNSDLFNKKANVIFEKLQTHFEKSMILTLDAEEKNLHPYVWDKHFIATNDTNNAIPLGSPSIFDIVHNTQKSFHGPVVLNNINEKFFDNWNQGTMPAHITIVPLIINSRPAGVILSVGERTCYTFGTLKFYENLSMEFANELSSIIESTAA